MSDDLISRAAAIAACELFDAPVSKSNWVNAQATAAQQIRGAIRALPGTPTPSDTGADSGPGSIPPQPGEAPVSDAPAPTMADLIDNLMRIEILTATGEGLDPATTIDVHLLAGIGRAVADDAAWYARATAWQPIETATAMRDFAEQIGDLGDDICYVPSATKHNLHVRAFDIRKAILAAADALSSAPVDNKISADPVGKEG